MSNQPVRKDLERLEKVIGPAPEERVQRKFEEPEAPLHNQVSGYPNRNTIVLIIVILVVAFAMLKVTNVL